LYQYGRTVAVCNVAGPDIACGLVRRCLAIDYVYFSKGSTARRTGAT
jgi:endonuclease YncB( thermonuclease family)